MVFVTTWPCCHLPMCPSPVECVSRLNDRIAELLRLVTNLSRSEVSLEEYQAVFGQRAKLMAEVGTLRARFDTFRRAGLEAIEKCWPCAGTGRLAADFNYDEESPAPVCGVCRELRVVLGLQVEQVEEEEVETT